MGGILSSSAGANHSGRRDIACDWFFLWLLFLNVFGCFVVLLFIFIEVSSVCCWSKKLETYVNILQAFSPNLKIINKLSTLELIIEDFSPKKKKGVEDHKYSTYYSQSTFCFLNLYICVKILRNANEYS